MIIRDARIDEARAIKELHDRSVAGLCNADYTPEQLESWIGRATLEKYQKRLEQHRSFIAEIDGEIVGYVRWNPATNELCSICVGPDHIRRGIATQLMKRACGDSASYGVKELWLDASLTAIPFYEAEGWETVEHKMHGILECVRMIKSTAPKAELLADRQSTSAENQD